MTPVTSDGISKLLDCENGSDYGSISQNNVKICGCVDSLDDETLSPLHDDEAINESSNHLVKLKNGLISFFGRLSEPLTRENAYTMVVDNGSGLDQNYTHTIATEDHQEDENISQSPETTRVRRAMQHFKKWFSRSSNSGGLDQGP